MIRNLLILVSFTTGLLASCGGGTTATPCAPEDAVSLALLGSSIRGHGLDVMASSISGQVVLFQGAAFRLQAGQKVEIQANVVVPEACRAGLRFSWGRTGANGETRSEPAWLDVNPTTGLISGTVPANLNMYSQGGSLVVLEMPGVKWRFLNFLLQVNVPPGS